MIFLSCTRLRRMFVKLVWEISIKKCPSISFVNHMAKGVSYGYGTLLYLMGCYSTVTPSHVGLNLFWLPVPPPPLLPSLVLLNVFSMIWTKRDRLNYLCVLAKLLCDGQINDPVTRHAIADIAEPWEVSLKSSPFYVLMRKSDEIKSILWIWSTCFCFPCIPTNFVCQSYIWEIMGLTLGFWLARPTLALFYRE